MIGTYAFSFQGLLIDTSSLAAGPVFYHLDAEVVRVTFADVPMPYAVTLELNATPNTHHVVNAVKRLLCLPDWCYTPHCSCHRAGLASAWPLCRTNHSNLKIRSGPLYQSYLYIGLGLLDVIECIRLPPDAPFFFPCRIAVIAALICFFANTIMYHSTNTSLPIVSL